VSPLAGVGGGPGAGQGGLLQSGLSLRLRGDLV